MGTQAWGATLVRLVLGVVFLMHGYYGYAVIGPKNAAGLIIKMGYPSGLADLLAWYLIAAHLVGGLLLIVGLWTSWAALAQLPIIASAVFLLHLPQGFFMRSVGLTGPAAGYEFPLVILVATLACVLLGGGALSLDGQRERSRRPRVP